MGYLLQVLTNLAKLVMALPVPFLDCQQSRGMCLLSATSVLVLRECETDPHVLAVIDGVVLSQEWVAEDEQWSFWWWDVEGHQADGAAVVLLGHVVFRLQVENVVTDDEANIRQALEIGAIIGYLKFFH